MHVSSDTFHRQPTAKPPTNRQTANHRHNAQPIFTTASLGGIGWLPQLGFAGLFLAYTELSKRAVRTDPGGWWARKMQW